MRESLRDCVSRHLRSILDLSGDGADLDANGLITLTFEGGVDITIEVPAPGETIYAHGMLLRLPSGEAETLLRRALAANLFQIGQAATWIALDQESNGLTLCAILVGESPREDEFAGFIRDFLSDLRNLGSKLTDTASIQGDIVAPGLDYMTIRV